MKYSWLHLKVSKAIKKSILATELFASDAYKKPIWIIATSIFCGCVWYCASFEAAFPTELEALEKAGEQDRVIAEEAQRFAKIHQEVNETLDSGSESIKLFDATLKTINSGTANQDNVLEGHKATITARARIAKIHSIIKATSYQIAELNQLSTKSSYELTVMENSLRLIEEVYNAYLSGDIECFYQQLHFLTKQTEEFYKELPAFDATRETARIAGDVVFNSLKIDGNARIEKARLFKKKIVIYGLAALFCSIYLCTIYLGIRNRFRKASKVLEKNAS